MNYSFHHAAPVPRAAEIRRRVRDAIRRHRSRVAHCSRADIAKLMNTRGSGWDDSLWAIWSEVALYRAVNAACHAHARGEHLNRWCIYPDQPRQYA